MRADKEAFPRERAMWHPVLMWVKKMIKKQRQLGGYSLAENPWPSVAWEVIRDLEDDPHLHDDDSAFQIHRIDPCQYRLRDQETFGAHWKPTGIATDSREVRAALNEKCTGDHVHQRDPTHMEGGLVKLQTGQRPFAKQSSRVSSTSKRPNSTRWHLRPRKLRR